MVVTCDKCQTLYNDTYDFPVCPHDVFEMHGHIVDQDGNIQSFRICDMRHEHPTTSDELHADPKEPLNACDL